MWRGARARLKRVEGLDGSIESLLCRFGRVSGPLNAPNADRTIMMAAIDASQLVVVVAVAEVEVKCESLGDFEVEVVVRERLRLRGPI